MATDAQLQAAKLKARDLRLQLDAVEEMNGYQARAYGVRALKTAVTSGAATTAGAISEIELGPVKLRWVNWAIGSAGAVGQVLTEPDGAADVLTGGMAGFFYGQLAVTASGQTKKPTPTTPGT